MQSSMNEVGVDLAPVEDADWTSMGPIDFAKYLCDKGEFTQWNNKDQWPW